MFSLGVVLYVLLSGIEPFKGKSMDSKLERNRRAEIQFPEPKFSRVSHEAKDLILSLLSAIPEERLSPA
jgi:calcium-dependent protein kinase